MSKSALLSFDREARKKVIYHEEDGKTFVQVRQDASHMIEQAKILAEKKPNEWGLRFLGTASAADQQRAIEEGWYHDHDAWRKFFNDRDNRAWNGGRERVG